MSEHLSREYVARYLRRELSPAELMATDDHLAACSACRKHVGESSSLQRTFASLRENLESEAKRGTTHLTYEQLEAYVDRQLDAAERETVDFHAEACAICRGELADLQKFRDSWEDEARTAAARNHPVDTIWQWFSAFWRVHAFAATATAIASILIVFGAVYLVHKPAPTPTAKVVSGGKTPGTAPSPETVQKLETPPELAMLVGKKQTLLGVSIGPASFDLLSPVGTFVEEIQPIFRWQALSGASEYQVVIFDSRLNQVEASPALKETSWRASVPLKRGQVYLWQVAATANKHQVVSPTPPAPEAKFKVLDEMRVSELDVLRQQQPQAHLVLGLTYARAGVLDQAEKELSLVSDTDPSSALAKGYIKQLRAIRPSASGQ